MYSGVFERFFLFGVKRVIVSAPHWSKFNLMKKNYPYIDKKLFPPLKGDYLFFYEEELKDEIYDRYLKGNEHLRKFSPEFNRIMGTILGYPPNAVEFFSSERHKQFPEKKIALRYCGVECVGSMDDMVEDVQWLWEKYPYPDLDMLTVSYKRLHVDIQYGDINYVKELQEGGMVFEGDRFPRTFYIGADS